MMELYPYRVPFGPRERVYFGHTKRKRWETKFGSLTIRKEIRTITKPV
jgi:hypothetical protein